MSRWSSTLLLVLMMCLGVPAIAPSVGAEGPDYGVPATFLVPWDCGQAYRVTWEPPAHWANGKATGIAWDFSMPAGTVLTAPFTGTAYFRSDERPLATTYGHYVEIIDTTGHWLVRLAHLNEPQYGERFVRAGELIGYSGSSGGVSAHLHLELLVRDGSRWVRPDLYELQHVYGMPIQELALDAYVVRGGCLSPIELAGLIEPLEPGVSLGEITDLRVPLYNVSRETQRIDTVQVALFSLDGERLLSEATGPWEIEGGRGIDVIVPVLVPAPGSWYVGRMTYRSGDHASGTPARGGFEVGAGPLELVEIAPFSPDPAIGERARFAVLVENVSAAPVTIDDLVLEGLRPDGVSWQALAEGEATILPGAQRAFTLTMCSPLQRVGYWTLQRLSYVQGENHLVFAQLQADMAVYGPQLELTEFSLYHSQDQALVLLRVENVGTEPAPLDAIEVWGWKPTGESFASRRTDVAMVAAGQSALVSLAVPLETLQGTWLFVEAGYWLRGGYVPMSLPGKLAVAVATANPPGWNEDAPSRGTLRQWQ